MPTSYSRVCTTVGHTVPEPSFVETPTTVIGQSDRKRKICVFPCVFQSNIDNLNQQIDQFESEIENLQARRKKLDRDVSEEPAFFFSVAKCLPKC